MIDLQKMRFKVWDEKNQILWYEVFSIMDLAKSHRFPENAEDFLEIIPCTPE